MTKNLKRTVTTAEAAEMKATLELDLLAAIRDFEDTTGLQLVDCQIGKIELTMTRIETREVKLTAVLP